MGQRLRGWVRLGRAWAADYAYVGFWQVNGFLFRRDPSEYLVPDPQAEAEGRPVVLIPGVYEN